MIVFSFNPEIGDQPKVLILGSMPGRRSLKLGQYYGHPRNYFWKIMGEILGFDPSIPYRTRVDYLLSAGIGLWDVLKGCKRENSLDMDIEQGSEIPNELGVFLEDYQSIRAIAFNGSKSWDAFKRLVLPNLPPILLSKLELFQMPSTSPANARMSYGNKLERWKRINRWITNS
jgi:hypoxanthine-DNA glycosylase